MYAYSRRALPSESPKLTTIEATDNAEWPSKFPSSAKPSIFLSGLGTTRAQAGSVEAQRKIDYDLNLALAKAAAEAGVKTYVLISSGGASSSSPFAYPKMKGQLEEEVQKLGFEHTVILRPGLIVGTRDDSRPTEAALRFVATAFGKVNSKWLKDTWAQDATVIGRAAVNAGLQCADGKRTEKGTWIVGQADIVRLGRTEWSE